MRIKGMHNAREYRGIQENTGECMRIQWNTREYIRIRTPYSMVNTREYFASCVEFFQAMVE